jgi:HK97 family phage major capsid protein
MLLAINNRSLDEMAACITELENLTSQPGNLTKKQEQRHAALLAKVSALKLGVNVSELRRWEQDRLLAAAGMPKLAERGRRGRLDDETENEWRSFARGDAVRPAHVPKDAEIRANEAGTQSISLTQSAIGGAFVPLGMSGRAFETMKQYDQLFDEQFSNVVETETGANTAFPVWDDVTNASVQVTETAQSTEVDVANFGNLQLNAYAFRSRIVAVSLELLQDSNFPLGAVLERVFAMRHARGVGAALVNGSGGGSAPTGLITAVVASGASPVIVSGSSLNTGGTETGATSIGTQDINALYHKLDPAYRIGACFYMNDSTLSYLEGLLDKEGRPIVKFSTGLADQPGVPFIYGKRVAVCPSMPSMASGHNPVVFGNPLYFVQRRVPSSMYVRRFWQNPSLVQFGLVGFESWVRVDSGLVAPNANYLPYQYIQSHS